jgi:hypothetical protein
MMSYDEKDLEEIEKRKRALKKLRSQVNPTIENIKKNDTRMEMMNMMNLEGDVPERCEKCGK